MTRPIRNTRQQQSNVVLGINNNNNNIDSLYPALTQFVYRQLVFLHLKGTAVDCLFLALFSDNGELVGVFGLLLLTQQSLPMRQLLNVTNWSNYDVSGDHA
eukprot:sb/3478527/